MSKYFIFDNKENLKSIYEDDDSIRKDIAERNKGLSKSAVIALDLKTDSAIVLDSLGFDSSLHELLDAKDSNDIEWMWSKGYGDIDKRDWTKTDDQKIIDKVNELKFSDFNINSHDAMRISDSNDDKAITVVCTDPSYTGVEVYIDKDITQGYGTYRINITYVDKRGNKKKAHLSDPFISFSSKAWKFSPYNTQRAEPLKIRSVVGSEHENDGGITPILSEETELSTTCKECNHNFTFKPEDFYILNDFGTEGISCPDCGYGIIIIGYDEPIEHAT